LNKQERTEQLAKLNARKKVLVERLDAIIALADVYARAKPIDKITIVRSLQRQGHVASMTGDGVNDAPALKQANIGVAMGITGTDVAKAASSMVLIDDNFCSIVEAIEQGRTIYNNIQKFVFYLLSTNVSEVFFILIAVIIGLSSPLEPIQILWLNLTTDGAPAIALALERVEPGVMKEGPRPKRESLIEKVMITGIIVQTITMTTCCLVTYVIGLKWYVGSFDGTNDLIPKADLEHGTHQAKTMSILYIVFAELLRGYGSRSLRNSLYSLGPFSNTFMQYSVSVALLATVFIALVPGVQDVFGLVYIPGKAWAFVIFFAFVPITVDEITKFVYRQTGFGRRLTVEELKQNAANAPAPLVKINSRLLSNV
jgi:Ca2+-transporting ATPase